MDKFQISSTHILHIWLKYSVTLYNKDILTHCQQVFVDSVFVYMFVYLLSAAQGKRAMVFLHLLMGTSATD